MEPTYESLKSVCLSIFILFPQLIMKIDIEDKEAWWGRLLATLPKEKVGF